MNDGMHGFLNKNQLEYVLFHLNYVFHIHSDISKRFVFLKDTSEIENYQHRIIFVLSESKLDESRIKWINSIPILFPLSNEVSFYQINNNNLIFRDDILKSTFYLLSGYQEYRSDKKDKYGRFIFKESIQFKLRIIQKPVVNYYFEEISKGVELFSLRENISFQKRRLVENFGFILTHDIDRVDAYGYDMAGYIFKQLIGLRKRDYSLFQTLKKCIISFYYFVNILDKKNPFWTFPFLREVEKENGFKSVFFILRDEGKLDAKYSIFEKRMVELFQFLLSEGCELGIHGTMSSGLCYESMQTAIKELGNILNQRVSGCRQHYLQFHHPETFVIQEQCDIQYDSSLCFAEHEGFRNSYCLPFKSYHFDEDRMIHVWEIPLNIMDVTLFGYRKLTFDESLQKVIDLIAEVKKFHGVFTLLWHNCFFDEYQYKGITYFYKGLIREIKEENPQNLLGEELVLRLNQFSDCDVIHRE